MEGPMSEQKRSEMAELHDRLEQAINLLHDNLKALAARLSPVLAPLLETESEMEQKDEKEKSPMAMLLKGLCRRVESGAAGVQTLIDRLDI